MQFIVGSEPAGSGARNRVQPRAFVPVALGTRAFRAHAASKNELPDSSNWFLVPPKNFPDLLRLDSRLQFA